MSNIAIVGCGNIGSRLLQSCVKSNLSPLAVTVIEKYTPSQAIAKERFVEAGGNISNLTVNGDMTALPNTVDLLIIASSAEQRLTLLIEALKHTKPAAVLLEKILFTEFKDYPKALEQLSGIPSYVNTTRNIWPGYLTLLEALDQSQPIKFHYSGTDWNLGSNGIHMLSVAEKLTASSIVSIDISEAISRASKREGYVDLTGTMTAQFQNGSTITLESLPAIDGEASIPLTAKISQDSQAFEINEAAGTINSQPFEILFASQLGELMASLASQQSCGLPTLQESSKLHLIYLKSLQVILHPDAKHADRCMVT